jgi:hypothetical protein
MEDILEVCKRPDDPLRPLVCMDECPKQLIGETRLPIASKPGQAERFDTEYVRNGTCDLFVFNAPLLGWRRVTVTERRTMVDWAEQVRYWVDIDFHWAEKVVRVMDNLNTHRPASLYDAFKPEEARRILERFGNPLHAETWELAKHGRNRIQRVEPSWAFGAHSVTRADA